MMMMVVMVVIVMVVMVVVIITLSLRPTYHLQLPISTLQHNNLLTTDRVIQ